MEAESVSLHYQDAKSDKVYHVQLEKNESGTWSVNFQFGRRRGTLQTGTKTPGLVGYADAKRIYDRLVSEKKGKGYREQGAAQAAPIRSATGAQFVEPELLTELSDTREVTRLIADGRFWLQEKRDGHRCLVVKQDGRITRFTRTGKTADLPASIYGELERLPFASFILDGEIEGNYLTVFDCLELDGDLRAEPYAERYRVLGLILERGKTFTRPIESWMTEAAKAETALQLFTGRAEGLVFKDMTAPYAPGRAHHFKFKFVKTLSAKVLRQTLGKESVAVGVLKGGQWVEVGNVSTHGHAIPNVGTIVEVRYLYATQGGRLYQAAYLGVRTDVGESACTFEQLIFKQGVEAA